MDRPMPGGSSRVRMLSVILGLALGIPAVASGDSGPAQTAERNRYFNQNSREFERTAVTREVRFCQQLNVRFTRATSVSEYPFPYGSIERQSVRAKVGSKKLTVTTQLRDVNVDHHSPTYNRLATEFIYGCTYLTRSDTTIGVRRLGRPAGDAQTVRYQEDARIFHRSRDQFRSRRFRTIIQLPARLSRSDLRRGRYCLQVTQRSESIARPWDANQVQPFDPEFVGPGESPYSPLLVDPTQPTGMLGEGETNPGPLSKSWRRCIRRTRQVTFRPPRNSPWTNKPQFTS